MTPPKRPYELLLTLMDGKFDSLRIITSRKPYHEEYIFPYLKGKRNRKGEIIWKSNVTVNLVRTKLAKD